jgi:hypothetical protein
VREVTCSRCGKFVPTNDSSIHGGQTFCSACIEELKGSADVSLEGALPGVDPTICAWCGKDNGSSPLPSDGVAPVCHDCHERHLRHIFPAWVLVFLGAVLAVAAAGMAANLRFFRSWTGIRMAKHDLAAGRLENAATRMAAAAALVPESEDLAEASRLYEGLSLLQRDRPAEALPLLQRWVQKYPGDKSVLLDVLIAEYGAAFYTRQYEQMYRKAVELRTRIPNDDMINMYVASAAACRFAESGDERYRREAEELIRAVRARVPPAQADIIEEGIERIQYRLESRQIIDRAEYYRRFPERRRSTAP